MASTSGSSEMSLRRFDGSNFNFWKEQMQDYLIVKGQIDLWTTTPKFVLHPTDRHLGGSVRSVSIVAAVNRSRIGTESVSIIGIRHIHSEPNRAHSDSATSGKTSRFCPSSYRNQFELVQHTYIRNRTDSGSNPTRTTSGEPTGCTQTQFVVNSEPGQAN